MKEILKIRDLNGDDRYVFTQHIVEVKMEKGECIISLSNGANIKISGLARKFFDELGLGNLIK